MRSAYNFCNLVGGCGIGQERSPTAKESKPAGKKLSQIEAAIQILGKSKVPMNCIAMIEAMQVQGLWSTPGGATP